MKKEFFFQKKMKEIQKKKVSQKKINTNRRNIRESHSTKKRRNMERTTAKIR